MEISVEEERVIKQALRKEIYDKIQWNTEELIFRNRPTARNKLLADLKVSLGHVLEILYRRSAFGIYLEEFNRQQIQDAYKNGNKYDMMNFDQKEFTEEDWVDFIENNNSIFGNVTENLKEIKNKEVIDTGYFMEKLCCIRLNNCHINELDDGLRLYKNLKIIFMDGNWISKLIGSVFPRKLQVLELFANCIESFDGSIKGLPPLVSLGLRRNLLHDGSSLHLLGKCDNLRKLKIIDLSENEISTLTAILQPLSTLPNLAALHLQGNPCYVCAGYKNAVLGYFPLLHFLDNVEVLDEDRVLALEEFNGDDAALVFVCHRIIGLPAPPKQKGILQTIHLEVSLPLLEEIIIPIPDELVVTSATKVKNKSRDSKVGKSGKKEKSKSEKSSKKSKGGKGKKGKKGKGNSPYDAPDELGTENKEHPFLTERVPWSKVIEFPEETLVIRSPEGSKKAIRDTFRTVVNVKVVYLKILPPQKSKKKDKKSKKAGKGKNSKKGKGKGGKGSEIKIPEKQVVEEPKETIQKRVTLANFNCTLHSINWSDKTIDFYWADHPQSKPDAISVDGSLKAIKYVDGKGKGKDKKKTDKKKKDSKSKESIKMSSIEVAKAVGTQQNVVESLPKMFTVQVGFGLKRY